MPQEVQDYVSGMLTKDGPEERVTQEICRWLVEVMGYDKAQLQTRPQWKVPRSPSSGRSNGFPCDIAVFDSPTTRGQHAHLEAILEIKAPNRLKTPAETEKAERELKLYLQNEPVPKLGVLTNGVGPDRILRIFYKFFRDDQIQWRELRAFPRAGELPDLGTRTITRRELVKATDLKALFRDIRNHIHSTDVQVSRDEEIIREIVALLLCKIYDEDRGPDDPLEFYWSVEDTDHDVAQRVNAIYRRVREQYPEVFDERDSDTVRLDPSSIRFTVAKLQRYELTHSDRHAIGDAFEIFIGDALKGKEGQYFTPRNVIKSMVQYLDPTPADSFIDPACGTGGFLASVLDHVYQQIDAQLRAENRIHQIEHKKHDWANRKLRGIDKEALNIKFSKAEVALLGNGHQGLFRHDSINYEAWPDAMKTSIKLGTFDVVMTNPPFGSGLRMDCDDLPADYDLIWEFKKDEVTGDYVKGTKRRGKQEIGVLFLELCLKLLKPGGRAGIVFSEGHLATVSDEYISSWLLQKAKILGIIDLPDATFQPHTHAKTCILFLEKTMPPADYSLMMSQARRVGHNDRGAPMYRLDEELNPILDPITREPVRDDDLDYVTAALQRAKLGEDEVSPYGFRVNVSDLQNNILIPRYYDRSYVSKLEAYADEHGCELVEIDTLQQDGTLGIYRGHGGMKKQWYDAAHPIPYIRTSNISGMEIEYQSNHVMRVPEHLLATKSAARQRALIQAQDILFVRRGENRIGDVAIVYAGFERILCANEIDVVRVLDEGNERGITAELLLYLLAHPQVRAQMEHKTFYETIIWNIGERWRQILLPIPRNAQVRAEVTRRVADAIGKRREGLIAMRELWEQPPLPHADDAELLPMFDE